MQLTKPRAILFDWDNTLADTWPTIHEALTVTFEKMGRKPWTMTETKIHVHRSLRDSFPDIFGDRWEEAGKLYRENFLKIHLEQLTMLPDAERTLKTLAAKPEIYVALVSNKTGNSLREEVAHVGFGKYFRKVIGALDAKEDKPSAEPVHMALDGTGIKPSEEVWFVGDSVTDMECAHNSGCLPVFYGDRDINDGSFVHCPPRHHFIDHAALIDALERF